MWKFSFFTRNFHFFPTEFFYLKFSFFALKIHFLAENFHFSSEACGQKLTTIASSTMSILPKKCRNGQFGRILNWALFEQGLQLASTKKSRLRCLCMGSVEKTGFSNIKGSIEPSRRKRKGTKQIEWNEWLEMGGRQKSVVCISCYG